ncbi:transmembrane sensor [Pedobacter africanus]|uniref:Ferric-dicitrate binding protein FerR (Iron transport regulator) n=1 Tax=Pedobacter africanus TaxID=151894 RepID=A0ACC6KR45_9SPHI|nr:FecR domain-containing protein [Pedobacter africanus]MDR6781635.1 ferric-dicitrate binding protein FerR (iron transport regulator) [Pedobacter africanus]
MDSKNNYKAEDFLSGRVPEGKEHLVSDSERELGEEIKAAVKNAGQEKLTALEVAGLWERIEQEAVAKPKRYTWKLYLQAAAVLFAVLGIGMWQYLQYTPTHKLMEFAAQNVTRKSAAMNKTAIKGQVQASDTVNEEENIITTNDFNTLVVGAAQRSVIKLPDGTKVWLNSGSRLIYPVVFSGDSREVYLEGEAYFDVTHDKAHPFYVRATNMDIKVLGTEFYVSSDAKSDKNYAVLVKGSISFSTGNWLNKVEKKLVPGQQISYDLKANKLQIAEVKTAEFESWKEGLLHVEQESLEEIVQKVARYYRIEIGTQGLDLSETFSGTLYLQRAAEDVLKVLFSGTSYVYNSSERRVELRKR